MALAGLTSLKEAYESALLDNSSALTTVESSLRNVSWLLPGRFKDAELASEGLYSLTSVVSTYHDSLLNKRLSKLSTLPPSPFPPSTHSSSTTADAAPTASKSRITRPPPSDHARYTSYFCARSPIYRRAARMLVVIGYVQLLLEMLAIRRGRKGPRRRWKLVLWLEGIKTFLRLLILGVTGRSVLQHPIPQRECDPTTLMPVDGEVPPAEDDSAKPPPTPIIPTLGPGAPVQTHLLPLLPLLPEEYQTLPLTLLPPLTSIREVAGEVIHASSGFLHIALMLYLARRLPSHTSSPTASSYLSLASPLPATLIPLGLLLISRTLRPSRNPQTAMTPLQAQLEQSRDRELAWWFIKGAIYERWTKPKLDRWIEWGSGDARWKRWMGLGLVSGLLQDHQKLVEELYYYTSS